MKVTNKRDWAVEVARNDFHASAEPGETIDVPDAVGESLVKQTDAWEPASIKGQTASKPKEK